MTSVHLLRDLVRCSKLTSILDIGANPIDGDPPYKEMLGYGLCSVTGFEPQQQALATLQQRKGPLEKYRPEVVADGRDHRLRITKAPGMTSLLAPDRNQLRLFHPFADLGAVLEEHDVQTHRLDDLDIDDFDLLKIDVQGSELMVFQNGRGRLENAVAVQTEMSLVPLYHGQPTFGDVDNELRSQGFMPHSIADVKRWAIAPTVFDNNFYAPGNQVLEADLVYIRDLAHPERMTSEQLSHLAMIGFHIYGSVDLTVYCILELQQRGRADDDAVEQLMQLFD
ncbi:FkbM family methyltransferase [Candidatus Mycobacterium wuenschmannii]|uniref:FkbM family methyltransferase n=1 Tax=Candidatus Mycobacterium wuenschmannii TaxID=3027808 RepID=A0ABY8W1N4_9MYCO|nr:FkbM family methyltransferase [Candidatus Mycobacterium wuenschmannii]WIM89790.1 FkbM family methyltransferase [Candidatus Mycobacterium wuenschmannii]